ncbi:TPA: hypothetical protein ENG04_11235 [Candidatus Poribacteria bacterium]|nr:hypothetical protein [Candidatus Poribacteria bacterium]HEX30642.1 hypothetical protein [Candidatus Poribacteria bacterium]
MRLKDCIERIKMIRSDDYIRLGDADFLKLVRELSEYEPKNVDASMGTVTYVIDGVTVSVGCCSEGDEEVKVEGGKIRICCELEPDDVWFRFAGRQLIIDKDLGGAK